MYLGIFTSAVADILWFRALKIGKMNEISSLTYLTPFVALIFIYFLVGEKILLSSFIGLLLIIGGVLIQMTRKRKKMEVVPLKHVPHKSTF